MTNKTSIVDPSRSKTFETVGADEFSIKYVDRSYAKGDYFTDSFEIGGATVKNLTMGLGRDTDIGYGLVGIGYALNEAIAGDADDVYPNLPVTMVNEGLINSIAYSLWLNDLGKIAAPRDEKASCVLTHSRRCNGKHPFRRYRYREIHGRANAD